jgi:hypothetical protein
LYELTMDDLRLCPVFILLNGTVDCAQRYSKCWCLGLVRATGKLIAALPALPDSGPFPVNCHGIALRAAVEATRNFLNICDALAGEPAVPATKAPGTPDYLSLCRLIRICHKNNHQYVLYRML